MKKLRLATPKIGSTAGGAALGAVKQAKSEVIFDKAPGKTVEVFYRVLNVEVPLVAAPARMVGFHDPKAFTTKLALVQ